MHLMYVCGLVRIIEFRNPVLYAFEFRQCFCLALGLAPVLALHFPVNVQSPF